MITLIILNAILIGMFSFFYVTSSGGWFGMGDVMGQGILIVFVFPIVLFVVNVVACFILFTPNYYFFLLLLPILMPLRSWMNSRYEQKRFSKLYDAHFPVINQLIEDTLLKHGVEKRQRSLIHLPQDSSMHADEIEVSFQVFVSRDTTTEQKNAIRLELEQQMQVLYPLSRQLCIS